jgi:hypothetical protein
MIAQNMGERGSCVGRSLCHSYRYDTIPYWVLEKSKDLVKQGIFKKSKYISEIAEILNKMPNI